MKILVINAGSSSLKYQLIDMENEHLLAKGICEQIGDDNATFTHKVPDNETKNIKEPHTMANHGDAIQLVLDTLVSEKSGVIAGSNERSVLFAVYEYLKRNGCRWLYPGIDGEYIPLKNIEPVSYRHVADMRFLGPCIEGAINQKNASRLRGLYAQGGAQPLFLAVLSSQFLF